MSSSQSVVFLKLSGEIFGEGNPDNLAINPLSLSAVAKKISKTYEDIRRLGMAGLVIVPGAGNLVRGDRFESAGVAPDGAHRDGRLATIINADRMAAALTQLDAPNVLLTAPSISYQDGKFMPLSYSAKVVGEAISANKIVIIGGGNGEDNATTDNAVAFYAGDYARSTKAKVIVLKGTKYDGVFNEDPKTAPDAKKIKSIGAPNMLADFKRYSVIDKASLQRLIDGNLSMLVYKAEAHDVAEILRSTLGGDPNSSICTTIVPYDKKPVFY